MTTSITSAAAQALVAAGKAAVEQALTDVEAKLAAAKAEAVQDAATLATQLATYLNAHAAEVSTAQTLITRANSTVTSTGTTAPVSAVPAITLNKPFTVGNTIAAVKAWVSANGWKGYVVLGLGLLALRYMYMHNIII